MSPEIDVRTHPKSEPEARETHINIQSRGEVLIYSEQSAIMRRLLRNPAFDVARVTLWEGDVVAVAGEGPRGIVGLKAIPRDSDRISKIHSTSGMLGADEAFRGGLDGVIEEAGDGQGVYVDVPDDVREARLEAGDG